MNALYSIRKGVREYDNFEVKKVPFIAHRMAVITRMLVFVEFQILELQPFRPMFQVEMFG